MSQKSIELLLIEDNPGDALLLKTYLESASQESGFPFTLTNSGTLAQTLKILSSKEFDVILLDLTLPDSEGIDTLFSVRMAVPEVPIVILTGVCDEGFGLRAVQAGAQDYLIKGQFDGKLLIKSIRYSTERHSLLMELEKTRKKEAEISESRYQVIKKLEAEINDRKIAEEKLSLITKELQTIFTALPDLYFKTDSSGVIIDYKSGREQDLFTQPEIFIGKSFTSILPSDVAELFTKAYSSIKDMSAMETVEYKLEMKDGLQYYEARILPLVEGQCVTFVRNITERKKAVEAIMTSEKKYRDLADSLPQIVFEADINGNVKFVNKIAFEYFKYSAQDLENGLNSFDMLAPESRKIALEVIKNAVEKKKPNYETGSEYMALRKDGTTFPVVIHSNLIFEGGVATGIRGILIDITEQKRAEETQRLKEQRDKEVLESKVSERTLELRRSNEKLQLEIYERQKIQQTLHEREERYRALAENTYDLITEVDIESRFLYLSPNIKEMLGYNIFELVGRYYYEFVHKDDIEKVKQIFKRGFKNYKGEEISYRFKHKNGSFVMVESTGKIYQTAANQLRAVIVSRDITLRKQMEREMLKASKLEALGTLAGGIAHDFNNILMGIAGNLNLAKKRLENPEKAMEVLLRAEKVAYKAKTLTEQLITFSKGGMPIKKILALKELIKDSVQFSITGSNVLSRFNFDDELYCIQADEGQITQVITNFAINAKQAMPEGGVLEVGAVNVTLAADNKFSAPQGRYVKISIKDDGVGIAEENMTKIFDPYFTTKSDGTGLGLATSYSIVKNHNGFITVDSKLNEGTVFNIYFPSHEGAVEDIKVVFDKNIEYRGKSVLLMDDDETVLLPVSEMLADLGYKVKIARNGEEALKLYKKSLEESQKVDIVITDLIVQGGMGGKETIEGLLKMDPDVCAIVSSGYSNDPVMAHYDKYGFRGVLAKPYQIEEMNEILRRIFKEERQK
ncbi:MAG: Sporulation kinase A [bacterium ADurb.Bin243]|nr:MAG: Sporulation kinase A [bacterium ADurb.Bin243]